MTGINPSALRVYLARSGRSAAWLHEQLAEAGFAVGASRVRAWARSDESPYADPPEAVVREIARLLDTTPHLLRRDPEL